MKKVSLILLTVLLTACTDPRPKNDSGDNPIITTTSKKPSQATTIDQSSTEPVLLSAKDIPSPVKNNLEDNNMQGQHTWQTATVSYISLEGGFYGLITESGAKLLPMNLAKQYRLNGSIVRVKGNKITDMMTLQQWGTPFQITEIKLIKKGESSYQ